MKTSVKKVLILEKSDKQKMTSLICSQKNLNILPEVWYYSVSSEQDQNHLRKKLEKARDLTKKHLENLESMINLVIMK